MATVKGVIDAFLALQNLPIHASYVGSTAPAQLQYLALLKYICDNLRNRPYYWPQLKRSHTFTTVSGEPRLQLPGDFYKPLESTQWDITNSWPLRGPVSDYERAIEKYSLVSLQSRKSYRIIGPTSFITATAPWTRRCSGYIELSPTPDAADSLYMEYISCNYCWPQDWAASTAYTAGDIRSGDGQIYIADANGTSGTTRPNWSTGSDSDGGMDWSVYMEPYTWASDSDFLLFDEDLLINGMIWAYLQAKNQDYAQQRTDWENAVRSATARFEPSIRLSAADEIGGFDDWPILPAGPWSV